MKLEIEVTEQEIKSAIERKVRVAIADEINRWGSSALIDAEVKRAVPPAITSMVAECLVDHDGLRNKIIEKIERAMTAKVQAALRLKL